MHGSTVLETVRKNLLHCKASKCDLGFQDVLFLGHMICGQSIFDNYFRPFIDHYSTIFRDG